MFSTRLPEINLLFYSLLPTYIPTKAANKFSTFLSAFKLAENGKAHETHDMCHHLDQSKAH
jgi:hypothetical protein